MADNALKTQRASLSDLLLEISQGRFHEEATAALTQLVKEMNRVADVGGGKPKGKLVLTINFMMDRGIMEVDPGVKITTPATPRARVIMYTTPDGRLSKNDTRQGMLDLDTAKDVSTAGAVREVDDVRSIREIRDRSAPAAS
jgi:hypothetical protein